MTQSTMQKAAVLQWVLSFVAAGPLCAVATLLLLRCDSCWWLLAALYLLWHYWDRDAPRRGGRRVQWIRRWRVWRLMAAYFPVKLHRTEKLSEENNYILGFHPHGVLSTGAFLHFATEATGFSEQFPGITPYLTVLDGHFDFPIYREYIMTSGAISIRRESLQYVLQKRKAGQLVCVIPGGANEALDSHPGNGYRVHLKQKYGFIKMALLTGSHLVPCISFGEIDLFNQVQNGNGTLVRRVQNGLMRVLGFSMPIFSANWLLPFAKPIDTVVGSAITVQRNLDPSESEVQELHKLYMTELKQLFDNHKQRFGKADAELLIC